MRLQQRGFTLIELIISLAIGLIVVAAAIMLFISSQKSIALQQGASDIQDNSNFALNSIAKDIRLANLGNSSASMTSSTVGGGIVLNKVNLSVATTVDDKYLSKSKIDKTSNTDINSDQLVIQYLPLAAGRFDCEGNEITSTSQYVIQRYFVRKDDNFTTNETADTALALACDAGRYSGNTATNFGDNGQIVMKRVDYFHVLLVAEDSTGSFRNIAIDDYMALATKPRIIGVKIGVLARSSQSVGTESNIDNSKSFNILGQKVSLNKTIQNAEIKNLREVIAQSVAIRNALGAR